MTRDLDEDLIEATIRRVAASKAARVPDAAIADGPPDEADATPDLHAVSPIGAGEDLIEATIRRVAASKAARLPDAAIADGPPDEADATPDLHAVSPVDTGEDLIEATIRRVAASKAARLPDAVPDSPLPGSPLDADDAAPDLRLVSPIDDGTRKELQAERPPADESLIDVTLHRIEAQRAARAAEHEVEPPAPADTSFEHRPAPNLHLVEDPEPELDSGTAISAGSWPDVDVLRRDVDDTRRLLRELTERVDAIVASRPEQPRRSREPSGSTVPLVPPPSTPSDEDWNDAPRITGMDVGLPPRPAIVRDALSPETATARPDSSEPAPLAGSVARGDPPLQGDGAQPKRGFDLLPRTYRITVEDKRRGVDLVPLHRALLGMDGVRDMSLLSYSNGTAIVSLEATAEIAADALGAAVSRAMAREVNVEVHNEQTMVIKLAED